MARRHLSGPMSRKANTRLGPVLILLATSLLLTLPASAAQTRTELRVCADPNYLPYSDQQEAGFENRIAQMLARELGLPVEYTWFPQRMGFIRNTLRAQAQDGRHKCDIVLGVPDGFELAITTEPYYRSTYALVYVQGRGLDDIRSGEDLLAMDDARKNKLRFGLAERNPGTVWLAKHGLLDRLLVAYASQLGDPGIRPGELEQRDLIAGRIDLTVMWGPIAGYFARHTDEVQIRVVPLLSEPGVKFDFAISAGVRFGEREWKDEVQSLLDRNAPEIEALLRDYGVPLVAEDGSLLK